MDKKTLLIIDDHDIFRDGIKSLLQKDYSVIGESAEYSDAERLISQSQADIILLDISLGKQSGFDLIPHINEQIPEGKIILLSMHNKPMFIKRAIMLKVDGFVLKESPYQELSKAITMVSGGHRYLDPACSDHIMDIMESFIVPASSSSGYNSLSEREQQIFRFLALRENTEKIGKKLFISKKTVENHRSNIYVKLGVGSQIELIKLAEDLGVIQ